MVKKYIDDLTINDIFKLIHEDELAILLLRYRNAIDESNERNARMALRQYGAYLRTKHGLTSTTFAGPCAFLFNLFQHTDVILASEFLWKINKSLYLSVIYSYFMNFVHYSDRLNNYVALILTIYKLSCNILNNIGISQLLNPYAFTNYYFNVQQPDFSDMSLQLMSLIKSDIDFYKMPACTKNVELTKEQQDIAFNNLEESEYLYRKICQVNRPIGFLRTVYSIVEYAQTAEQVIAATDKRLRELKFSKY